jgi:glucitol operon activator protein
MWGAVILLMVVVWVLQIVLTILQSKHFSRTVKEMSNQSSGYLGVGVAKQKLGVGTVIILISDLSGKIVQAKEMTGVTVFSRFKPVSEFVGNQIEAFEQIPKDRNRNKAIRLAVEKIKEQVQLQEQQIFS